MKAIIVDLDGTLSNSTHRQHFVATKPKNFKAFYENLIHDEPHEWCEEESKFCVSNDQDHCVFHAKLADNCDDAEFIAMTSTEVRFLLESVKVMREALESFQLYHEHQKGSDHFRMLGDNYGWCDICATKMRVGEDDAREALKKLEEIAGR